MMQTFRMRKYSKIPLIWPLIVWHWWKVVTRPDVLPTITSGMHTDSVTYLGLSGCYVASINSV